MISANPPGRTAGSSDSTAGQPTIIVNLTIHTLVVNCGSLPATPFNTHLSRALDVLTALGDEVPALRLPLRPLKRALEEAAFAEEVAA